MKNSIYIIIIASIIFGQQLKSSNNNFTPQYTVICGKFYIVTDEKNENNENLANKNLVKDLSFNDFMEKIKPPFFSTLIFGDIVQKITFGTNETYAINFIHKRLGSVTTAQLQGLKIINEAKTDNNEQKKDSVAVILASALAEKIRKGSSLFYNDVEVSKAILDSTKNSMPEYPREGQHTFTKQVTVYDRDYSKPFYLAATIGIICIGTLLGHQFKNYKASSNN